MKSIFKNWFRIGVSMVALIVGVSLFVNALNQKSIKYAVMTDTTYYFDGNSLSDTTDPGAWTTNPEELPDCDGVPVLPCSVTISESIEDFLRNKTPSQIMADPLVNKKSQ